MIDPYPPELLPVQAAEGDPLVKAIHRLATAVEQNTLALLDYRPAAVTISAPSPTPVLAQLPPVQGGAPLVSVPGGCPIHHTPWKNVPAGISKKTGQAYTAFVACSTQGCDQRPPR